MMQWVQKSPIEQWAGLLVRHFGVFVGIIGTDTQVLILGRTTVENADVLPKHEVWQNWFQNPKKQHSPFLPKYSDRTQTLAVPVHMHQTCVAALFVSGFCLESEQNQGVPCLSQKEVRLILEMMIDKVAQIEKDWRTQTPQEYKPLEGFQHDWSAYVANCPAMLDILRFADQVCDVDANILIEGQIGTGKKSLARLMAQNSKRKYAPLIVQNCAALSESMLESELFGHKRGTLPGALTDQLGLIDIAQHGTFVLENIDALTLALQAKLLRVITEGISMPLGETMPHPVDVRIIATCQGRLADQVKSGTFSADLYHCFASFIVALPDLKDRQEDILPLCHHIMAQKCAFHPCLPKTLTDQAAQILFNYTWPGNIRELENEIQRLMVLSPGDTPISIDCISPRILQAYNAIEQAQTVEMPMHKDLHETKQTSQICDPLTLKSGQTLQTALDDIEKQILTQALAQNSGNRTKTAEMLGISRRNLIRKIENMGIEG